MRFKVTGPTGTHEIEVPEDSEMLMIEDAHGNQLGVDLHDDGTFNVGGWNAEGEWIVLEPREATGLYPDGDRITHPFDLNQFTAAEGNRT